jgi:vacuolar-type H+-ATPase subunit I/STV1
MSTLSDNTIIDNTHFEVDETERLICYTNLPDGSRYAQAVSSKEAVQKNMIGWCNTVRDHVAVKERQEEEERVAKKSRRKEEIEDKLENIAAIPPSVDARQLVIQHYHSLQQEIDLLSDKIKEADERRKALRDERDKLGPVMEAWGVTE